MDEYIIVHLPTGETVKDGFSSDDTAYQWLAANCENGTLQLSDINEYAVEKVEDED